MQPEDFNPIEAPALDPLPPPLPVKERDPFWGYSDLIMIIGLAFAGLLLMSLAIRALMHAHPQNQTALLLPLQLVLYVFIYFCFYLVFKVKYGRPVLSSLGWKKTTTNLAVMGVGGVLLAIFIDIVSSLVHTPKVDTPFDELLNSPLSIVLLAFTAVVAGPMFEEAVFRGFLQPLFSRTVGNVAGILLTAALFGSLHLFEYQNVWQYGAAITIVGIVLGVVRARTNSIIPGTVLHGCFNSVSVIGLIATKFLPHK